MNEKEFEQILKRGESESIEFKKSTAQMEKALKAICGFVNNRRSIDRRHALHAPHTSPKVVDTQRFRVPLLNRVAESLAFENLKNRIAAPGPQKSHPSGGSQNKIHLPGHNSMAGNENKNPPAATQKPNPKTIKERIKSLTMRRIRTGNDWRTPVKLKKAGQDPVISALERREPHTYREH